MEIKISFRLLLHTTMSLWGQIMVVNPTKKKTIIAIIVSLICLLLASSCCNKEDEVYWPPDEAIRYYDENDTIKFYCPEIDSFETYIVCLRDSEVSIEQYYYNRYCQYTVFTHAQFYRLYKDSCDSPNMTHFAINGLRHNYIQASVNIGNECNDGTYEADFEDCKKFTEEVLGFTYNNVIEIPDSKMSELPSILFSYEYGVIQIKYEDRTFSLINNEI